MISMNIRTETSKAVFFLRAVDNVICLGPNVYNANSCWHFKIYDPDKVSCSSELIMT